MNARARSIALVLAALAAAVVLVLWLARPRGTASARAEPTRAPVSSEAGPSSEAQALEAAHTSEIAPREALQAAPPAAAAGEAALVVELVHEDGSPVSDMRVLLACDERVLGDATTDERGLARFEPQQGRIEAFVLAGSALRLREELAAGHGRQRVVIPLVAQLAGIATIDGEHPGDPLRLWVETRSESPAFEALPAFALRHLGWHGTSDARFELAIAADGRFRFDGLAPTWSGKVRSDELHRFEDGETSFPIERPSTGLALRLVSRPSIRGRVVDRGGTPIPAIAGRCAMEGAGASMTRSVICDQEGRFQIPISADVALRMRAELGFAEAGVGRVERTLTEIPPEGIDLGDLVLEPIFVLVFRALTPERAPIAGAVAWTEGLGGVRSEPTESDGLGRLAALPLGSPSVTFGALGFQMRASVVGPESGSREAPLEVVLERGLGVVVILIDPQERPLPELKLVLGARSDRPFLDVRKTSRTVVQVALGASDAPQGNWNTSEDEPSARLFYEPDRDGRVRIAGLRPELEYELSVLDEAGGSVLRRPLVPALYDETSPLVIVVEPTARVLELVVSDPEGRPVQGAEIWSAEGMSAIVETDAHGIALVGPLYTDEIDLVVRCVGFVTGRLEHLRVQEERVREEITLSRGRSVRVLVRDEEDTGLEAWISGRAGERSVGRSSPGDAPGTYDLRLLPEEPVVVRATVGWRTLERTIGIADEAVDFVVPRPGSVRVLFDPPLEEAASVSIEARTDGSSSWLRVDRTAPRDAAEWPVVLPGEYELILRQDPKHDDEDVELSRARIAVRSRETTTVEMSGARP